MEKNKNKYDFTKPIYVFESWDNLSIELYEYTPEGLAKAEKEWSEGWKFDHSPLLDENGWLMTNELVDLLELKPILRFEGYAHDSMSIEYKEFTDKDKAIAYTQKEIDKSKAEYDPKYAKYIHKEVMKSLKRADDMSGPDYVPGKGFYLSDGVWVDEKWW